jgi:hypothetical protein
MSDLMKWVLGLFFALLLGSYSYTHGVDGGIDTKIEKVESRISDRLDRFEQKLDRFLERH